MTVIRLVVPRAFAACAPWIRVRTGLHADQVLELQRLGYVVNESNADFAVAYYTSTTLELDHGMQSDPLVTQSTPGTVIVDVIDPTTKEPVWRGRGNAAVADDEEQYDRNVKHAVQAIVEKFPAGSGTVVRAP